VDRGGRKEAAMELKIYRRINKKPIMLAGWQGMGDVALRCMDFLRRRLEATAFAEITIEEAFIPDKLVIKEGIGALPPPPHNYFYYSKETNIVIFESPSQLGGKAGGFLMDGILSLAQKIGVTRIITGAAFPLPISHTEPSTVYGVASSRASRDLLIRHKIKIMEKGEILGLNGLLIGYAKRRDIEAICLLATLPLYAVNFFNPKASKALVEAIMELVGFRVDTTEFDLANQSMNETFKMIEQKITQVAGSKTSSQIITPTAPEESEEEKEKRVPDFVLKKIESLFEEAKTNKEKSYLLKEELDKWGLFKLYEDRFLDLFKKEG
jgi:proteasome assembly chaperone (PAC2) family protein